MKRMPLRRKPRKDPVTEFTWGKVMTRDLLQVAKRKIERGTPLKEFHCIAWVLDPLETCSGRLTLDHVNDQSMRGKRAPSDEQHLVMLCEEHHLGMKAGRNWATSHRPQLREYLWGLENSGRG